MELYGIRNETTVDLESIFPYRLKANAAPTRPARTVTEAPRAAPALSSTWGIPVELAAAPDEEAAEEDPASEVELESESDVELAEVDSVLVPVLVEVVSVSVEEALVLEVVELVEVLEELEVDEVLEASPVMLNCSDWARMPVFFSSFENRLIWKPWLVSVSYFHTPWVSDYGMDTHQ